MKPFQQILLSLVPALSLLFISSAQSEQPVDRETREAIFRDAKFGMFIHWGLYAIPARGEWVMHSEKIQREEYATLAETFNPTEFNAKEWVRIAKDAGMKYIVITSKHHDGFAMYGSKASPFNIIEATPFRRDPLKELAEACKEEGIGLGFYYSHSKDWHHPGGDGAIHPHDPPVSFDEYLDKVALPQLRELLTGYGSVFSIWFDTPAPQVEPRAAEFVELVRSLQPQALINSRLIHGGQAINLLTPDELNELEKVGVDYFSYADRQIPANSPWPSWETCMTLNESWGYTKNDTHWKSPRELITQLIKVASRGGNFLLNVGPTAEGIIPQQSVENLRAVGDWLRTNGEAIYGTQASPLGTMPWGHCTLKRNDENDLLYLHVFDWPKNGRINIPGLQSKVKEATILGSSTEGQTAKAENGTEVILPPNHPFDSIHVIRLALEGPIQVSGTHPAADEDGTVTLDASTATLGGAIQLATIENKKNINNWTSRLDTVAWTFSTRALATYEVTAEIAGEHKASEFTLISGDARLVTTIPEFKEKGGQHSVQLGTLNIPAGIQTLLIVPKKGTWNPVRLRSLTLTPVSEK